MTMGGIPTGFIVGLIAGGTLGFIFGILVGGTSRGEKKRSVKKENKAQKLFNLALEQDSQQGKMKLLKKVLDKYPHSEWADKALEEVARVRKEE